MIIKKIEIEQFRSFENVSFELGKYITAISGRNATQKTTVLGMLGQPFTISRGHNMYGCKTIDGYNFRSQFKEKFKISPKHDLIGKHKWTLFFRHNIYEKDHYTVESIARNQNNKKTLRFWNAESRAKGAGYVQIPVYYLSLSRLFPIGESKKTNEVEINLKQNELEYCIKHYREILSIQNVSDNASVGLEKGTAYKTFSGISDDVHDIFTNSAGEGNVTRIILAVLSFKRLNEQYGQEYKGGLLLIDELDATLYGFSQGKLVEYLLNAAKEFKIQIVFTTHSPIILKAVNRLQRKEYVDKGSDNPSSSYDNAIVYLEPDYDQSGTRIIKPRNIMTNHDLNIILNDLNLFPFVGNDNLRVYCEDAEAMDFLKFILKKAQNINLDLYMKFMDVNLGWTNYIQLYNKKIPEFKDNIIVLDGDVLGKKEFSKFKNLVKDSNILFLPLTIEKDLFSLLKDHANFIDFKENYSNSLTLTYDICFNNWTGNIEEYKTNDFKNWYKQIVSAIGDKKLLFQFWCDKNSSEVANFINKFKEKFNELAEKQDIDQLPNM